MQPSANAERADALVRAVRILIESEGYTAETRGAFYPDPSNSIDLVVAAAEVLTEAFGHRVDGLMSGDTDWVMPECPNYAGYRIPEPVVRNARTMFWFSGLPA